MSGRQRTLRKGASGALKSRRKFRYYFPGGFHDETYIDWERNYKWRAHQQWEELLNRNELRRANLTIVVVIGSFASVAFGLLLSLHAVSSS
jgi:hypothetical protein